jgi:hypothetical protein
MSKVKVLGEQYGVTITRPFSREMYAHNNKVAAIMKENITKAINNRKYTADQLNEMTKSITAYTFGMMSREEIREEMLAEVDRLQDWWLAQEYPNLVEGGFCKEVKVGMVGFDKIEK